MSENASPPVEDLIPRLRPRRKIEGISAVLLPFREDGAIDFEAFEQLVTRTLDVGITPAVNMDTGYANLISDDERRLVLETTRKAVAGKRFVAGAFVEGREGEPMALYGKQIEEIVAFGGTPIVFQSSHVKGLDEDGVVAFYRSIGERTPSFIGFELGEMFVPFGAIYSEAVFERLLEIPQLIGAKHSSLRRDLEWKRLEIRDRMRPEFKVYTGNDLAIDLVMWGSDYLLGLSAFHPEAFAVRDRLWELGDSRFYALNDLLQYLGFLAFRAPVPAYKHNAAQFLHARGRIATSRTHPDAPERPDSDVEILQNIAERIDATLAEINLPS